MKLYIMWCRRCQKYVTNTVMEAENKQRACDLMQDKIKHHDLAYHPDDGFPEFDILAIKLPKRGSTKKARGW